MAVAPILVAGVRSSVTVASRSVWSMVVVRSRRTLSASSTTSAVSTSSTCVMVPSSRPSWCTTGSSAPGIPVGPDHASVAACSPDAIPGRSRAHASVCPERSRASAASRVPGVTIDRQCGSSVQAVHFAAQGVMSGTQELVVAGGLQNMSAIPISAAMLVGQQYGFSTPFAESPGWQQGTATRRSASSAAPR